MTTPPTPLPDPRYPIGRLKHASALSAEDRAAAIDAIAATPAALRSAVQGLSAAQIDTPYRDGGWTVRQLVHHVADSHMNAFIRFRLALTEETPTVKAYEEAEWAKLADAALPIDHSLDLLAPLHLRLVHMLRSLRAEQFARTLLHPQNGTMTIDGLVNMYAWHGRHHTAHVTSLRERMGWHG